MPVPLPLQKQRENFPLKLLDIARTTLQRFISTFMTGFGVHYQSKRNRAIVRGIPLPNRGKISGGNPQSRNNGVTFRRNGVATRGNGAPVRNNGAAISMVAVRKDRNGAGSRNDGVSRRFNGAAIRDNGVPFRCLGVESRCNGVKPQNNGVSSKIKGFPLKLRLFAPFRRKSLNSQPSTFN